MNFHSAINCFIQSRFIPYNKAVSTFQTRLEPALPFSTQGSVKARAVGSNPIEKITAKIYFIRGLKDMLDRGLAQELYEVETKQLKRAARFQCVVRVVSQVGQQRSPRP